MPHTMRQLERLGIAAQGKPLRRAPSHSDGDRQVSAPFRCSAPGAAYAGPPCTPHFLGRRDNGRRSGSSTKRLGSSPRIRRPFAPRTCKRARYLAAADGLHSPIRRSLSAWPCPAVARAASVSAGTCRSRRGPTTSRWSRRTWAPRAEAYVTPGADRPRGDNDPHLAQGWIRQPLRRVRRPQEIGCTAVRMALDRAAGPLRQKVRSRTGRAGPAGR